MVIQSCLVPKKKRYDIRAFAFSSGIIIVFMTIVVHPSIKSQTKGSDRRTKGGNYKPWKTRKYLISFRVHAYHDKHAIEMGSYWASLLVVNVDVMYFFPPWFIVICLQ